MPEPTTPSRFLAEIPGELVEDLSRRTSSPARSSAGAGPRERFYEYDANESVPFNSSRYGSQAAAQQSSASSSNVRRYFGINESGVGGLGTNDPSTSGASAGQGLKAGSRVRHAKYGYGTVLRLEGSGDQIKLTVSFPGIGLKKLMEKFAELERL